MPDLVPLFWILHGISAPIWSTALMSTLMT